MIYIGVDPGRKGAIAIGEYGRMWLNVLLVSLPQTCEGLRTYLWSTPYDPRYAAIALEKAFIPYGEPKAGQTDALWRNGQLAGWLEAITDVKPYIVPANTWKKAILGNGKAGKAESIAMAQAAFPDVSLLRTKRSRKPDDNYADALCLMLWAQLNIGAKGD